MWEQMKGDDKEAWELGGRGRPAGVISLLFWPIFWLWRSCVPVLVTDRRAMQGKPGQGKTRRRQEEKKRERAVLLGLGRVELSSVKAMKVTRPTSSLPTEPKQRFKTKATRSRYSAAVN